MARNDPVSLTIDHDTPDIMAISGLSMEGHAQAVTDLTEAGRSAANCIVGLRCKRTSNPGS